MKSTPWIAGQLEIAGDPLDEQPLTPRVLHRVRSLVVSPSEGETLEVAGPKLSLGLRLRVSVILFKYTTRYFDTNLTHFGQRLPTLLAKFAIVWQNDKVTLLLSVKGPELGEIKDIVDAGGSGSLGLRHLVPESGRRPSGAAS